MNFFVATMEMIAVRSPEDAYRQVDIIDCVWGVT
jgi:hypothetical protein